MFMKSSVNMLVKIRQAVINHLLRKLSTEQLVWSSVLNFPVKSFRALNIICEVKHGAVSTVVSA